MGSNESSTEPNTLLNKDPFRNEDTQRLFEAIDQLRSCGANHEIDLPELVIVGDQSAGKSSLLQSLTDIPFPVDERLCTRFPTRIVSRRTPNEVETTKISIEASSSNLHFGSFGLNPTETPDKRNERFQAYGKFADRHHSSSSISAEDFRRAIKDAKKVMGITEDEPTKEELPTTGTRHFASDVLKVEISGPDRSYFSILDVPGVFHSLTKGLTPIEKDGVRNMVASYMMPKQSIIICVASGTNDLANQATFDMASEYDPKLQRTIGVITKCDVTQHKKQVLSLAQGKEKYLARGWFVVRNRTPEELEDKMSNAERQKREEDFFNGKPWDALPESQRGTQALKNYLSNLLCQRIQEVFPSILTTIQKQQASTRIQLENLGPPRTSTEKKRTYLTDLAQQLHRLTSEALRGRYHGLVNKDLRLRRLIYEANTKFTKNMIDHGHRVPFQSIPSRLGDGSTNMDDNPVDENAEETARESYVAAGFGSAPTFGSRDDKVYNPGKGNLNDTSSAGKPSTGFGGFGGGGGFGMLGSNPQPPSTSAFGNLSTSNSNGPQNPSLFGKASSSSGSGLFGTNPPQPSTSAFGNLSTSNSNGPQNTSSFGKASSGSGSGLFGPSPQPLSTSAFGNLSTSNSNGPQNTSSFGKASSGSGSGLFGPSPQPPSTNAFGNPSTSTSDGDSTLPKHAAPAPHGSSSATSKTAPSGSASSPIYEWIREEIKNCRGTELQGTLNPDVLPVLFHRQIAGWEGIAMTHFESVADITRSTLEKAVSAICGNKFTAQHILTLIRRTNDARETRGLRQLQERFKEITSRHLQTQNPIFENNIRNARLSRFKAALMRYHESHTAPPNNGFGNPNRNEVVLNLLDVTSLFDQLHISNAQNLEDEIHDTLKSYYELALHDFIEFVTQQVVESYLNDPRGPVLFFNPTYISSLTSEDIEDIGGEDPKTAKERLEYEEILSRLKRAEEIALKHT